MTFKYLRNGFGLSLATTLLMAAAPSNAVPFEVFAYGNSSSGGTGLSTLTLTAGESFTVTANPADLWSAGSLPRFSNADGLEVFLNATGSDESGYPLNTIIGAPFSNYSQGGLTAPFGSLVGKIGSGVFFVLGTNYTGIASTSGVLNLFYWDVNFSDNSGSIIADVSTAPAAVPEPGTLGLLAMGLLAIAAVSRRKRAV